MRTKFTLGVLLALAAVSGMAAEKATADQLMEKAQATAAKQNKSIFVKFDASW
jgi:hypothetical protein